MRRRIAAAALCAVLAALLPFAAPVNADSADRVQARGRYVPPEGGHFNVPIGDRAAQTRIKRVVLDAIQHARKGSYIKIALFSFDRRDMGEALIKAHRRGVHVQVLLNEHQVTRTMRTMRGVFRADRRRKSFIYQCRDGCRGGGFLHTKLYLFSKTGVTRSGTVMIGSANLTTNAEVHQWNDLMVLNNAKVYDKANVVFEQMRRDRRAKPVYRVWDISSRYELQALPHPHTTRRNDPIMNVLEKVHCRGATRGTGTNGRTKIRANQHRWSGNRGAYIARRMIALHGQGCDVRLMHGSADDTVRSVMRTRSKRGMVPLRANGFDENGDGEIDRYTHTKYLTISGNYGKDRSTSLVLTGSSNWAGIGVHGDDVLFLAKGRGRVADWNRNFNFIWDRGSRPVTYRRPGFYNVEEPKLTGKYWEND